MKRGSAAREDAADGETKDVHHLILPLPLRAVPVGVSHLDETREETQGETRRPRRGRSRERREPARHAGRGAAVADIAVVAHSARKGLKQTQGKLSVKINICSSVERSSPVREVLKGNVRN
jgi:hypothetical protein